ncbi:MAG: alpha/beta fold hydrolase [Myxococcota bacterium]|nr:alpha/beta fold hydrolase [Myxococcota bacterium]
MTRAPGKRVEYDLPGGTFHALVLGEPDAPPLVWLHGFPDHPPTALPFLEPLAAKRRVIAPWLRGYAPSPLRGPYDLGTLRDDAIALIDAIGAVGGPVDLVGHDWGAVITYAVCGAAPDRVRRAVTLAVPHPRTFLRALRQPSQLARSWYMGAFQLPGAMPVMRARGLALIDRLWRTWSPQLALDEARRRELHGCLAASLPAPVEYYRAARQPASLRALPKRIATPLLQLHGADDGCVLPPRDDDAWRFAERVLEVVPNAGHFLHLEDPPKIAARVASWLA